MRTMRFGSLFSCMFFLLVATPGFSATHGYGTITPLQEQSGSLTLSERWERAYAVTAHSSGGFWIGYSVEIRMEKECWIGTTSSDKPTLRAIIEDAGGTVTGTAKSAAIERTAGYEYKTIGILAYHPDKTSGAQDITQIELSDITFYTDLKGQPLVWLGVIGVDESAEFLTTVYQNITSYEAKHDIVAAICLHRESPAVIPFMERIISAEKDDNIRSASVFWVSQQNHPDIVQLPGYIIANDTSLSVKTKAVFSLSLIKTNEARDMLFSAAHTAYTTDIRKQALFWLAESDIPAIEPYLIDILKTNPSIDVRKEAVFGLSHMHTPSAEKALIETARTPDNAEAQKQAILWLGQCGDSQAVETLISMLKEYTVLPYFHMTRHI